MRSGLHRSVFDTSPNPHLIPLPLRGVPRRGEGCDYSIPRSTKRILQLHPPSLRDTSLKGGGFRFPPEGERGTVSSIVILDIAAEAFQIASNLFTSKSFFL